MISADLLYSLTLLVAMLCATSLLVCIAFFVTNLKGGRYHKSQFIRTMAKVTAFIGISFLIASVLIHIFKGHTPGGPESLGFLGFLKAHPALVFTGAAFVIESAWINWLLDRSTPLTSTLNK